MCRHSVTIMLSMYATASKFSFKCTTSQTDGCVLYCSSNPTPTSSSHSLGWCVFLFHHVIAVNVVQKEYSGQSVTSGHLYKAQYGKLNVCCSGSNNFFESNFVKFETMIS